MGGRAASTSTEKRLVWKVYQEQNEWVGRWSADPGAAPIRRNDTWFAGNKNGQVRNIAAQLFGISAATVRAYWQEMPDNEGVLTAANAIDRKSKTPQTSL